MRQREAQDTRDQLVTQAAQQALAEAALVGVDVLLEPAVHQDGDEEQEAEHEQVADLVEVEAHEVVRELDVLPEDALVEDVLRDVEGDVVDRQRQYGQQDEYRRL